MTPCSIINGPLSFFSYPSRLSLYWLSTSGFRWAAFKCRRRMHSIRPGNGRRKSRCPSIRAISEFEICVWRGAFIREISVSTSSVSSSFSTAMTSSLFVYWHYLAIMTYLQFLCWWICDVIVIVIHFSLLFISHYCLFLIIIHFSFTSSGLVTIRQNQNLDQDVIRTNYFICVQNRHCFNRPFS